MLTTYILQITPKLRNPTSLNTYRGMELRQLDVEDLPERLLLLG